jgi:uncharacterized protein
MRIVEGFLLFLCLVAMWYFVRNDIADYAAFKLFTETADRQRRYRVWVLKSFLFFCGTTLACLAILGRLRALTVLPPEFHALSASLQLAIGKRQLPGTDFLVGFSAALLMGLVVGTLAMKTAERKSRPAVVLGDIEPLMPRNWPETAHTAVLSLNAGLSEELFFRLLLPLLMTLLIGKALPAFICAAIIFGAIHIYQGAVGVVATTVLGFAFTGLYLWTGDLWIVVCGHALLDLIGLVIRPTIVRAIRR